MTEPPTSQGGTAPEGFPSLTRPDGTAITYVGTLTDLKGLPPTLPSEAIYSSAAALEHIEGAMSCSGEATLLVTEGGRTSAIWNASEQSQSEPVAIKGFAPGTPGTVVAPGLAVGLDLPEPDWRLVVRDEQGITMEVLAGALQGSLPPSLAISDTDLWAVLWDEADLRVYRMPIDGSEWKNLGPSTLVSATEGGVLSVRDEWSDPSMGRKFEVDVLSVAGAEPVVSGSHGVPGIAVTDVARSGDLLALYLQVGQGDSPRIVVVDRDEAFAVSLERPAASLGVTEGYVVWQETEAESGGPGDQYLLDVEARAVQTLGMGVPTTTFPIVCGDHIAWTASDSGGTTVRKAVLR
ncbi:MAG: hypothetical protein Q4G64_05715 [bacterium]|nr:hypothetical protein [bacterium]